MTDNSAQTMPMLIANLASGYTTDYGMLMMGVLIPKFLRNKQTLRPQILFAPLAALLINISVTLLYIDIQ